MNTNLKARFLKITKHENCEISWRKQISQRKLSWLDISTLKSFSGKKKVVYTITHLWCSSKQTHTDFPTIIVSLKHDITPQKKKYNRKKITLRNKTSMYMSVYRKLFFIFLYTLSSRFIAWVFQKYVHIFLLYIITLMSVKSIFMMWQTPQF